jgi:outer membrane protein assembly factor BamB
MEWPVFRGSPQMLGRAVADFTEQPEIAWTATMSDAMTTTPVIAEGRVFIAVESGELVALDLKTGENVWTNADEDEILEGSPLFLNNRVYFGLPNAEFFCLDATDGTKLWEHEVYDKILGAPNYYARQGEHEGKFAVIIGGYDGILYSLDAETGEVLWSYETTNYINGAPSVSADDKIIFGGCDALGHVLDAHTGEEVHAVDLGSYVPSTIASEGNIAYAGNYEGILTAFEIDTGKVLWEFVEQSGNAFFASPAVGENAVFVGSRGYRLHAVDKETGQELWNFRAGGSVEGSPVVTDDTVLFGAEDGFLYALNIADGSERWRFDLGARVMASMAIADGFLVIGDENGVIHAFKNSTAQDNG